MHPTRTDLVQLLGELAEIFTLPKGRSLEQLAATYHAVLEDTSLEGLRRAVHHYRRSDERFFPKPGTLRAIARKFAGEGDVQMGGLPGEYWRWHRRGSWGDGTGCPVCDAVLACGGCGRGDFRCTCSARLEVRHDHQRHFEAGIGYVGPRTGPVVDGRMQPTTWQEAAA